MSTIAYRDGILAGDSLVTTNTTAIGQKRKVFDVSGADGERYLVGVAGPICDIEAFVRWAETSFSPHTKPSRQLEEGEEVTEAIVVYAETGRVALMAAPDYEAEFIEARYFALGSGAKFALGAMHAGARAAFAVDAAKAHDLRTGGLIHTVSWEARPAEG